ncbi:MAG: GNAT family N-acetyltransferase [Bacteroidetes bacterium]|nr:GNAT family N-acetyltransferase [Rhodothermia bacterium]MCS7154845.1 GNAT family N-acetyltransferase [Bacteroidota bacterium]MCX7906997.1 GNAT family N-acetyltransferase [Bacteroidota bacterium]MDW8137639.1 GNAT family N-acetyltransferase [Bacteroidota bacterium]MDW8285407.1 GNAT family N-acetyltransferase [Bacteroidota bacterium]
MSCNRESPAQIESVGLEALALIRDLNWRIFGEERIINRFDRPDLCMLLARVDGLPVGFKIGYGESREVFYSAKGGVLEGYRRRGIARAMLYEMMQLARRRGYRVFAYDSFPNRYPAMVILGLVEGFRVVEVRWNPDFRDFKMRFEKAL